MSHIHKHTSSEVTTAKVTAAKSGFFDSFSPDELVDWLGQYGKNLAYAVLGLIVLLILVYRLSASHTAQSEQEYLQTANAFSSFLRDAKAANPQVQDDPKIQESLQKLTALIAQHPELHAAYDGAIAQTLLNRGQTTEAKPFIVNTLKRTLPANLEFYHAFAATTLLMSEGKEKQALENALILQKQMVDDLTHQDTSQPLFGQSLFVFNLLRIAMLQQELGLNQDELQTWQEWKQYAGLSKTSNKSPLINPAAFRSIIQQLATGSLGLPDYIAYRETILRSSDTKIVK